MAKGEADWHREVVAYNSPLGMTIIFLAAMLTPLQGFFNCLVFGLNADLTGYIKARLRSSRPSEKPVLRYNSETDSFILIPGNEVDSDGEDEEIVGLMTRSNTNSQAVDWALDVGYCTLAIVCTPDSYSSSSSLSDFPWSCRIPLLSGGGGAAVAMNSLL